MVREPEATPADFLLAIADLLQVVKEKDGHIVDVALHDRFKDGDVELRGKVLWFWPEADIDQYVVHSVEWRYGANGVHLGPSSHVALSNGEYFLFESFVDREPAAYLAARAAYERRT